MHHDQYILLQQASQDKAKRLHDDKMDKLLNYLHGLIFDPSKVEASVPKTVNISDKLNF